MRFPQLKSQEELHLVVKMGFDAVKQKSFLFATTPVTADLFDTINEFYEECKVSLTSGLLLERSLKAQALDFDVIDWNFYKLTTGKDTCPSTPKDANKYYLNDQSDHGIWFSKTSLPYGEVFPDSFTLTVTPGMYETWSSKESEVPYRAGPYYLPALLAEIAAYLSS